MPHLSSDLAGAGSGMYTSKIVAIAKQKIPVNAVKKEAQVATLKAARLTRIKPSRRKNDSLLHRAPNVA